MYKTTQFISRKQAERIVAPHLKSDRILISISTPPTNKSSKAEKLCPADLHMESWTDVLRLEFHDAEPSNTKKIRIYFDEVQALRVIEFLNKHTNTLVTDIFVHCDAGISRSAAISKFAAQMYGLSFDDNYRLHNKFVFSTLLKASGQIPRSAEESAFSQGL